MIKPLATSDDLEKAFSEFDAKLVRLEQKIDEKDKKITEQSERIDKLEAELELVRNTANLALQKCDDGEQYQRRSSLRVYGLPVEKDENLLDKIEECYAEVGLEFDRNEIDRVHRIGKEKYDPAKKVSVQPTLIKFKSWESRKRFYKCRPKYKEQSNISTKKPPSRKFTVGLDLTIRRLRILNYARDALAKSSIETINYAFADINCSLGVRFNDGNIKFFSSEKEFQNITGLK